MQKIKDSDVFAEYLRLSDESRLIYLEFYELWDEATIEDKLKFIKYNFKARLKCECVGGKGDGSGEKTEDQVQQTYYG